MGYNEAMSDRKKERHPLLAFALFVLAAEAAFAHQPRLVNDRPSIVVRDPEISQAFYARLAGNPQTYHIASDAPFRLYVNLLVPAIAGIETDYEAAVFRTTGGTEELLARLEGKTYTWRPFYEPFGGDRYLLGPEYDEQVPAGAYTVVVTSPDNTGKYVLAVGKIEKFPLTAMAQTMVTLPRLKRYFGKSPLTAYVNLSGVFLLITIGAVAGLATLVF
jgi:hypothetical protein